MLRLLCATAFLFIVTPSARAQFATSTTDCSKFGSTVSCSTTPTVYGMGMAMLNQPGESRAERDARKQAKKQQKINVYLYRVKGLISDDFYGDTLLARAVAKNDTTGAIRLARDRFAMDREVAAMLDTLNTMELKAGVEPVPHQVFHEIGERLQADSGMAVLADSLELLTRH